MQDQHTDGFDLDPALNELASALGRLEPATPSGDRDAMLFELGRANGRRAARRVTWCTSLASVLLAVLVTVPVLRLLDTASHVSGQPSVASGPASDAKERSAMQSRVGAMDPPGARSDEPVVLVSSAPAPSSVFVLRQRVLRDGVDALPEASPSGLPTRNLRPGDNLIDRPTDRAPFERPRLFGPTTPGEPS